MQLATEGEEDSYAARLGRTVLNNLRVNISDLHIRFEDVPPAVLGRPVCLGVQLADLRIVTTDAKGQDLFVNDEERYQSVKDHESRDGPPVRARPWNTVCDRFARRALTCPCGGGRYGTRR